MFNTDILNDVNSVLHLGACKCEEASLYRRHGIQKVLFVEANPELKPLDIGDYGFVNYAVHREKDKIVKFNIIYSDDMTNLGGSSLLELKHHATEYPHIKKRKEISCRTTTIDALVEKYGLFDLLVLDLQGAEMIALEGAVNTLDKFIHIYTEFSEIELYENCVIFKDLIEFLNSRGFMLRDSVHATPIWGDAWFQNSNSLK